MPRNSNHFLKYFLNPSKYRNFISKELYSSIEIDVILNNFLLICMGNFGVLNGFILLADADSEKSFKFKSVGFSEEKVDQLRISCEQYLSSDGDLDVNTGGRSISYSLTKTFGFKLIFPFRAGAELRGLIGLGERLMSDTYSNKERELLETLINSLVIALKNAKSFDSITRLNKQLTDKNAALDNALKNLRAEMKKVEILEGVKENLSKFVPHAVSQAIEKSSTGRMPESRSHELSVLFLDIEGYTRLCEKLGSIEVSTIIEKHFSVFMDAIHTNNGDVNETAGDGLMVLFLNEDKKVNALEAVRTAVTIQKETARICKKITSLHKPLQINIGINSGKALVGAAKFDSVTGSRWTYTARGRLINVAARLGTLATGGQTLLSKTTAERIAGHYPLKNMGLFRLKNVKEKVEVFQL